MTETEMQEFLILLREQERRIKLNKIDTFFPETGPLRRELYPKHMMFFEAGAEYKLRLLMAGNRVGKTFAAAFEIACHTTGIYPEWWKGKRFVHCNNWWICGVDSKVILAML